MKYIIYEYVIYNEIYKIYEYILYVCMCVFVCMPHPLHPFTHQ